MAANIIRIPISELRKPTHLRRKPSGYYKALLETGTANGNYLELTPQELTEVRERYPQLPQVGGECKGCDKRREWVNSKTGRLKLGDKIAKIAKPIGKALGLKH